MANRAPTLKEKLDQQLAKGVVNLSSADVADFEAPVTKTGPVTGDVTTAIPADMSKIDSMVSAAASGDVGNELSKRVKDGVANELAMSKVAADGTPMVNITITADERACFLESIISGDRFVLPFKLFNGKIEGKLRSRSQNESNAILARLNWETDNKEVHNALEFSMRLRNMLLAAQVSELRNVCYPALQEPLYSVKKGDKDSVVPPGWLPQVTAWMNEHEGLAAAVYKELQLFEQKYWIMVSNAGDQNFWRPAESI